MKRFILVLLLASLASLSSKTLANDADPLWLSHTAKTASDTSNADYLMFGHTVSLNPAAFQRVLHDNRQQLTIEIPLPDGQTAQFNLTQVSVMAPELAQKYPLIRSFEGVDVNNAGNYGRFDISPRGLSGRFYHQGELAYLAFDNRDITSPYVSYFAKHEISNSVTPTRQTDALRLPSDVIEALDNIDNTDLQQKTQARANGDAITTYRLAVSASGEYTAANGGEAGAIAEIARMVNRMNQIFLTDLSIQLELVANNDRLIFTDALTDPFVNDANEDLETNQDTIDDLIGSGNYDIGHLVNTDPGGLAVIQAICVNNFKARAQSGSSRPFGEDYYIQLVIHEFGHQLGAAHSFNGIESGSCTEDQRSGNSAVEPGSGTTIMSYAGICGQQDIQNEADAYFHNFSIEEIQSNLASRSCGTSVSNNNSIPLVQSASGDHAIPANTPFVLTAQVTDADNDDLSYIWDQVDPGGEAGATETRDDIREDNGANPLFRSFSPTNTSTRYFPKLSDVLNQTVSFGEAYPTTERRLDFELLVRDSNGGVNTHQSSITVVPTGDAFSVSQPAADIRWIGNENVDVSWNVADTDAAPISCANVDILLDGDNDQTFESTIVSATENDGQHTLASPNTESNNVRLMVKCSDNVFYAVNPGTFSIVPGGEPIEPVITGQSDATIDEDQTFTMTFDQLVVDDPDSNYPTNFTLTVLNGANYTADAGVVTPQQNFNGTLSVNVTVNDGISDSNIFTFTISVNPVNDAPTAVDDTASVVQGTSQNIFDVLANDSDADQDEITLVEITYLGAGSATIVNGNIEYTPSAAFFGTETIVYRIEDPTFATATGTLTIDVRQETVTPDPTPTPTPPSSSDSGGGTTSGLMLFLISLCIANRQRRAIQQSRDL